MVRFFEFDWLNSDELSHTTQETGPNPPGRVLRTDNQQDAIETLRALSVQPVPEFAAGVEVSRRRRPVIEARANLGAIQIDERTDVALA